MNQQHAAAQPRPVVVAVGAVTSQGRGAEATWEGVRDGSVAIRTVQRLSTEGIRTDIAGEVAPLDKPADRAGYPEGYDDPALDFALIAAEEAMAAAEGLGIEPERWGLVLGTCNAGLLSVEQWYLDERAGREGKGEALAYSTPQGLAEAVAGAHAIRGPVLSLNTACAAGANAVGYAAELIADGRADAVLTGGTDALSDVLFAGFNSLESLSPEPAKPYSADRQGLSLGEGAAMMVLVREDLAEQLGLEVLAQFAGLGLSADGYHPTAPEPEGRGAARAIQEALRQAGVSASEVGYLNSHGTGTAKNDPAETAAMRRALGEDLDQIRVSSTKSMIGHLLGAAGASEAMVTVKALQTQTAPPTAGLVTPDPVCDLRHVPIEAQPMETNAAICNNFAFGGANASLVLTRDHEDTRLPVSDRRVVLTGLGAVTSAGETVSALEEAVAAGEQAFTEVEGQQVGLFTATGKEQLAPRVRRRMDRLAIGSVVAAQSALEHADHTAGERTGIILGTEIGPMDVMERFAQPLFDEDPSAANPALFPNTVYNAAAGQVAMNLGCVGPTTTLTAGRTAGALTLSMGAQEIRRGRAEAILGTSAEALTPAVVRGLLDLGLFDGGDWHAAEGAASVLIEDREAALERGAQPLAELLGTGMASDGLGVGSVSAEGEGLERAIRDGLERAGVSAQDVEHVWVDLKGAAGSDAAAASALGRVLPQSQRHATRPVLGDAFAVGGLLDVVLAAGAISREEVRGPVVVTTSSSNGFHLALVLGAAEADRVVS
ncbi:beta-ketoacyl-[acyl-carrier-protein] synthase family protein [Kocuria sp. p3-SID1433]|uniref:beta-ketoacyl-[acyl-carrier-protein] synthase family protein n=1 Tax=unclassified Kocuria TaxID=2649579 RepID=UPI0021A81D3A|nr:MULTISPECIES: beta-ketoacyl-[acyl-carrier-protein] synthase family protein [unclassified Kocuria]MCT1602225.1 beta-ketoacyl-[acyl-carrier-protein] synthase family protein [Kocuria sp. p3-SID1428]MCT2180471.1 beta-ketoacyl-[acyl-carrier-protein] synthase family protein [Kocuria sp. p3-SID1433]